jgi:hypothetical protein
MTSDYDFENLSGYKHLPEFMCDQKVTMDREEELRQRYEAEKKEERFRRRYEAEKEEEELRRRHEGENAEEESGTEEQQIPSLNPSSAPQEELRLASGYQKPVNDPFTPPSLTQRQVGLQHVTSTSPHDHQALFNIVYYHYSTRNDPELQTVLGPITDVIKTLYVKIDNLETRNAVLVERLESAQNDLVGERQRSVRRSSRFFFR